MAQGSEGRLAVHPARASVAPSKMLGDAHIVVAGFKGNGILRGISGFPGFTGIPSP